MSNGPFKNLKLTKRWKRFAEAVQSDACDLTYCCALASDALLEEILTTEVKAIVTDLVAFGSRAQLDLVPLSSVEEIFNRHSKSAFTDTLQKEVECRVSDQMACSDAIKEAMGAAAGDHICEVKTRIEEECIRSLEFGKMRQDQFYRTVSQSNAILTTLANNEVCEALLACDKKTFKDAVSKKLGLDEGPSL